MEKFNSRFGKLLMRRNKPFQGLDYRKETEEKLSIVYKAKKWLEQGRELRYVRRFKVYRVWLRGTRNQGQGPGPSVCNVICM